MSDPETERQRQQEQEQEQSLARIEQGGIPLSAQRRLQELRTAQGAASAPGASFTSDLSIAGFALCHQLGLKPMSQVMGSSIYQVGYQGMSWPMLMNENVLTELTVLSDAWNEVRRRALNRMELEARAAGADAVVGVQLRTASHDWAEGAIEYAVLGTAVKREGAATDGQPVMTELSVGDYAKLVNAGVEPLGIVAWTSVFFVADTREMEMMGGLGGRIMFSANQELTAYTQGVYGVREHVMERIGYQAQEHGASGIVGMRIAHSMRREQVGGATSSRAGLVITFDAIGTAVRDTATLERFEPHTNLDLSA